VDPGGHRCACGIVRRMCHVNGARSLLNAREARAQEFEGFHVHVGLTSDSRYITITALSKSSTEVYLLDAHNPDSGPQLVHERMPGARSVLPAHVARCQVTRLLCPNSHAKRRRAPSAHSVLPERQQRQLATARAGLMYWVAHAHGQLIVMHNDGTGDEYHVATLPAPTHPGAARAAARPDVPDSGGLLAAAKAAAHAATKPETWRPLVDTDAAENAAAQVADAKKEERKARTTWRPLIECDIGILEDVRVYKRHVVLSCREKGVPVLRAMRLSELPLAPPVRTPVPGSVSPAVCPPTCRQAELFVAIKSLPICLWQSRVSCIGWQRARGQMLVSQLS
jgi:hypothetical protein